MTVSALMTFVGVSVYIQRIFIPQCYMQYIIQQHEFMEDSSDAVFIMDCLYSKELGNTA